VKVAVCFSGQIRGDYGENIKRFKTVLPNADYYFCTWENQKDRDYLGIINRFYKEPKATYNPAASHNRKYIKLLRKFRNGELDPQKYPIRWKRMDKQQIEDELTCVLEGRNKSYHHMKQHLGHAMIMRDFIVGKGYDIVIRTRYDCYVFSELKFFIKDFCEQVMMHGNPMGFHDNNRSKTLDHAIKPKRMLENNRGRDLNDFIVIHRADLFDADRTFFLYERKALHPAEGGWYQTCCEVYDLAGVTVSGFCRLQAQHDSQRAHVQKMKSGDRSVKYNAREIIQESSSDVYDLL